MTTDDHERAIYTAYTDAIAAASTEVALGALAINWLRTRLTMEARELDERRAYAAALEAMITGKREDGE